MADGIVREFKAAESADVLRSIGLQPKDCRQLYAFALVMTLAAALAFLALGAFRAGLGDRPADVAILLLFCILPQWTCAWAASQFADNALKAATAGCAGFIVAILIPIAGLLSAASVVMAALAFLFLALWSGRAAVRAVLFGHPVRTAMAVFLSAAFSLVFTTPARLYLPEAMLMGLSSPDAYYHASLAQIILHHGVFSIGADGLARNHYHFLSHFVAAGLSRTSNLPVPLIYTYWGTVSLKFQAVSAFFFASVFFLQAGTTTAGKRLFWTILFAWLAADLTSGFESESYMLSVALVVSALPLFLTMTIQVPARTAQAAIPAGTAILVATLCAAAKISVGFYAGIALVVAAWHYRSNKRMLTLLILGILSLGIFAYLFVLTRNGATMGADWQILAYSYFQYLSWHTLCSYGLLAFVILLLILRPSVNYSFTGAGGSILLDTCPILNPRSASLRGTARWFISADGVVQFALLALFGCLAVLLTQPIGDDMEYFSLPLYAFAMVLLPVAMGRRSSISLSDPWIKFIVTILLSVNSFSGLPAWELDAHNTLLNVQSVAIGGVTGPRPLNAAIQAALHAHKLPLYVLQQQIAANPRAKLIEELRRIDRENAGKLAVQVSPDAKEIWEWSKIGNTIWCTAGHLVVPSETGILEIRSVAPYSVEQQCMPPGMSWYGYGKEQNMHRSLPLSDAELCALGRPLGVSKVYRLTSYSDISRNRLLICSKG